jgi:hypothetical protein
MKGDGIMLTFREKSSRKEKRGPPRVCEALFGRRDTRKDKNTLVLRR